MKVRYEEKDVGQLFVGRIDLKKSKFFKRKFVIKGVKFKVDNRKSVLVGMILYVLDLISKEYENLEIMVFNFFYNDEVVSSDLYDEDRFRCGLQREFFDDINRRRVFFISVVVVLLSDEVRERGGLVDLILSEDGYVGDKVENDNIEVVDEEKSLKDDREKVIVVLKRVYFSRVCEMYDCQRICVV